LALAAIYLRRARVVGRSFAAGAPALKHVGIIGDYSTKPRRGPPAALPGRWRWRAFSQHGAIARIAPARPTKPRSTTKCSLNSDPRKPAMG
jgi:hypothetical protein